MGGSARLPELRSTTAGLGGLRSTTGALGGLRSTTTGFGDGAGFSTGGSGSVMTEERGGHHHQTDHDDLGLWMGGGVHAGIK